MQVLAFLLSHPSPPLLIVPAVYPAATLDLMTEKQNAHSNWIRSVGFSPDGSKIVSGSFDKTIKVWDAGACFSVFSSLLPLLTCAGCLPYSHAGSCDREAERAQRTDLLGGLLA